jgi:hypothetical protein
MDAVDSTGSPDPAPGADPAPAAGGGAAGRYARSSAGMVGALVVTLLVIGAFVGFRAFNRTNLDVKPERIDYLTQVRYAQEAGADVVYPPRLPAGWYATNVTISPGTPVALELSMLTPDDRYVGYVESPASVPDLLGQYVDAHAQGGESVRVASSVATDWTLWTDDGGDTALVAARGSGSSASSLLVFGTVSRAQLERLAASLTTARLPKG